MNDTAGSSVTPVAQIQRWIDEEIRTYAAQRCLQTRTSSLTPDAAFTAYILKRIMTRTKGHESPHTMRAMIANATRDRVYKV